jgi:hypothetical protein
VRSAFDDLDGGVGVVLREEGGVARGRHDVLRARDGERRNFNLAHAIDDIEHVARTEVAEGGC